jgi:hypothetical protein
VTGPGWAQAIAHAARMGFEPSVFWKFSLIEWRAIAGGQGLATLHRCDLEKLIATYPDKTHE